MFDNWSLRGWWRANSSMIAETSIGMSRWMFSNANPLSLVLPIVVRRELLILFSPLKERSEEQLVTGKVHKIVNITLILGNIEVAWRRAAIGVIACNCGYHKIILSLKGGASAPKAPPPPQQTDGPRPRATNTINTLRLSYVAMITPTEAPSLRWKKSLITICTRQPWTQKCTHNKIGRCR